MATFLPNIPQATDQLSISQGNLLTNFTVLGAIAGNGNASSASINSSSGFNWIYLPPQGSTPPAGAAFTTGNTAIYSASNTRTSQNEIYVNKQNYGSSGPSTAVQIPMTASILGNTATASLTSLSSGWTYLPSGIIIKWGNINIGGVPSGTAFNFPTGSGTPPFTTCLMVLITQGYNSTSTANNVTPSVSTSTPPSATAFTLTWSGGNYNASTSVNFIAIGY